MNSIKRRLTAFVVLGNLIALALMAGDSRHVVPVLVVALVFDAILVPPTLRLYRRPARRVDEEAVAAAHEGIMRLRDACGRTPRGYVHEDARRAVAALEALIGWAMEDRLNRADTFRLAAELCDEAADALEDGSGTESEVRGTLRSVAERARVEA